MDIKEKIKKLPCSPGVYFMKDSLNSTIYVGKSKNLKSRVSSYFQNSKSHSPKVLKLVKNLKNFDYITTDTEFEAFILECKLIRIIKPIYNRQMKNPKSYCYIKISLDEKYPDIEICNTLDKLNKSIYFGPYTSKNTVERAINGIKEFYKILCNTNFKGSDSCINYSMDLCIGVCLNDNRKKQYKTILNRIIQLLKGEDKTILIEMEQKMNTLSDNFHFEKAAKYRDYINAINYMLSNIKVINFANENKNIALLEFVNEDSFKFFLIRGNKLLFSGKYNLKNTKYKNLEILLKSKILFYFKDKNLGKSLEITQEEIDEAQIIYSYLKNKFNNCRYIIIKEIWLHDLFNNHINIHIKELLT